MTVMGDAGMEGLSDAGSIPARSTIEANNDTIYRKSDIQCRYFYYIYIKSIVIILQKVQDRFPVLLPGKSLHPEFCHFPQRIQLEAVPPW